MEEDIEELNNSTIRQSIKMCVPNMLKDGAEGQVKAELKQIKQPKWNWII